MLKLERENNKLLPLRTASACSGTTLCVRRDKLVVPAGELAAGKRRKKFKAKDCRIDRWLDG